MHEGAPAESEYLGAGHASQFAALAAAEKYPASQSVHSRSLNAEGVSATNSPAMQVVCRLQESLSVEDWYFPAGQSLHAVALGASPYVPVGQAPHAAAPAAEFENFPRGHTVQLMAWASEYVPGPHGPLHWSEVRPVWEP